MLVRIAPSFEQRGAEDRRKIDGGDTDRSLCPSGNAGTAAWRRNFPISRSRFRPPDSRVVVMDDLRSAPSAI